MVDVTLNLTEESDGRVVVGVKLQTPDWELNVFATPEELAGLRSIREADWDARRSLRIGECAGAGVFWAAEGETVAIMVGHDDETWDVAVQVPIATVATILAELAAGRW